jgi:hypothetical protein
MASQVDIDQSGTFRQWIKVYMGPSLGWVTVPQQNRLKITAAGTYILNLSTNLVEVDVAGAVTVILPSCVSSTAGAQALPGTYAQNPITIVDVGGFAAANHITIQPFGGETIMGLSSLQITVNYGGYCLQPFSDLASWNSSPPSAGSAVLGPVSSTVNDLALWANTFGSSLNDGAGLTIGSNYGWSGIQTYTNTTDATSTSTGALVLSGGLGIAKQLQLAGALTGTTSKFTGGSRSAAGPPLPIQASLPGATFDNPSSLTGPLLAEFISGDGSFTVPVTVAVPSVGMTRIETLTNIATGGGQNAALYISTKASNTSTSNNAASNGVTVYAQQYGTGDSQCIVASASNNSGGGGVQYGYAAIAGFFNALANTTTSTAVSIQTGIQNNTGIDATWATWIAQAHGTPGTPVMIGIDLDGGGGPNQNTVAAMVRGRWDVGLGFSYAPGIGANIASYYIIANNFNIDTSGTGSFTGSKHQAPTFVTTATYTVLATDYSIVANFAGTVTLTLPSTGMAGRILWVKTVNSQAVVSSASNVNPLTGATGTAILAATAGKWAMIHFDGSLWQTMAGN